MKGEKGGCEGMYKGSGLVCVCVWKEDFVEDFVQTRFPRLIFREGTHTR